MPYVVYLKKSAEKELDCLPKKIHETLVRRIISLRDNPRPSGAKRLQSREEYRIRVGSYRVLYIIHDKENKIEIASVAHRKEVYR
jgi:mRNA interferase RelE/StbE